MRAAASGCPGRFHFLVLRLAWCVGLGASLAGTLPAQERLPHATGALPMQVWRLEDLGASPINWAVAVQPGTGFVYVANQHGLLEFDGVRWRLMPLPRGGAARAVAAAADGQIWVGGAGQICVLQPDRSGTLRPVDVGLRLPEVAGSTGTDGPTETLGDEATDRSGVDARQIGNAPQPIVAPDGVYFVPSRRIARFQGHGAVDIWPMPIESRVPGWWSDDALHVVLPGQGIHKLHAGRLVPVANRGGPRVLATAPHAKGGWLWLTATGPVHAVEGRRTSVISASAAELLAAERPRSAAALPNGGAVFGMINHGAVVLDAKGTVMQALDRARGLPANRVNGVAADGEGGLWLAMHSGIVRVQLDTALGLHGLAQGLSGSPWQVARLREHLLVTHSEGVAWRDPEDGRFRPVRGITAAMHQIVAREDEALAAGLGLYSISPTGGAVALTGNQYRYGVTASQAEPRVYFHYGPTDVQFWRKRDAGSVERPAWTMAGAFAYAGMGADDVYDDGRGSVWISGRDGRVRRLDVRDGVRTDSPAEVFGVAEGLPASPRLERMRFASLANEVIVVCRRGAWRFDPMRRRFEPEARAGLGDTPAEVVTSGRNELWLYASEPQPTLRHVTVGSGGTWQTTSHNLPMLAGALVHSLFIDEPTRTLWMAAQGHLISFNLDWNPTTATAPLAAKLRRVSTADGYLLWQSTGPGTAAPVVPEVTLLARQRALRIEFSAASHLADLRGRRLLQFRSRAGGIDADWTAWSTEPHRDFTNLPDGRLDFEVQAREIGARQSDSARMAIRVLPPWWRTPIARVTWGVLALAAVSGFVALRTRSLRRRAAHLESVVAARTEELRLRNLELARLHRLEMDEKILAKLAEEKAQLEMLRYQLNPHFLLNAFTTLRGLVFTRPDAAGEMVSRLASFCRLALTRSDEAGATVAEEAQLVDTYLATERARWQDNLQCAIEVEPAVRDRRLPPFLLQPLVENAVKYGSRSSPDVLQVRVSIADDGAGGLRIEIANTGHWVEPEQVGEAHGGSTRLGVENVRRRLQRYYPEAHDFSVDSNGGWVRIRINLRLRRPT